jgi:paraquat-inducible protein A
MPSGDTSLALIACHDCDLLHHLRPLPPGTEARCARCGGVLAHRSRNSVDRALAWSLASLLFLILANALPLLTFRMGGREQVNVLLSGVGELWRQGFWPLSLLVLSASVLAPMLRIAGLLYVLLPIKLGHPPLRLVPAFRIVEVLQPWSMVEVFMLGVIVAIIKLSDGADVGTGPGLWAFAGLIIASTAATAALDHALIWSRVRRGGQRGVRRERAAELRELRARLRAGPPP